MARNPWQRGVTPVKLTQDQVKKDFRTLINDGCPLRIAGLARSNPEAFVRRYLPGFRVDLFQHRFYLSHVRRDNQFRFFVAFVQLHDPHKPLHKRPLHPRIFYKDSSLIWRVATHYINSPTEHWIGKGDIKPSIENGETAWYSAEETTNLPFEIQNALDAISRQKPATQHDRKALEQVLRNAPDDRVRPYADFSQPRQRAMANPRKRINKNQEVAWFDNPEKPGSLRFAPGFQPDFRHGFIEASDSRSRLYGGRVLRFRIASKNKQIQYLFMRAPRQCWIIPPQVGSTELISYGVRSVDVQVDEKLCIPGYEFHYYEDDEPPSLFTQIPDGFAGNNSLIDPQRADASPWNHKMPVMRKFHHALGRLRQQGKV